MHSHLILHRSLLCLAEVFMGKKQQTIWFSPNIVAAGNREDCTNRGLFQLQLPKVEEHS